MDADVDGSSNIYFIAWRGGGYTWTGTQFGMVYKVSPKGYKAAPLPDFDRISAADLVGILAGPSHVRRIEAQRAILRRKAELGDQAAPLLQALAADRAYMLDLPGDTDHAPRIALSEMNLGLFPMVNHQSRLQRRFYEEVQPLENVRSVVGQMLDADQALALGLVTATPDDIDWADEIRIAIEERASMSPDSLTGLEANLRFCQKESMETRIFGRLSAWQNWIFNRPNAVGEKGALKVYGKGEKAAFDLNRV